MPHNNIIVLLPSYCFFFCIYLVIPFLLLYIPSFVETAGDPNAAVGGTGQGGLLSPEIGRQQQQHWELDGLLESVVAPRRIQSSHTHDAPTIAVAEHSEMPLFSTVNIASGPFDQQQMELANHFEGSWQENYHPQHQYGNQPQPMMVISSDFPLQQSVGDGQQEHWQQESYDSLLQQPAATYYSQPNSLGIIHQQQQEGIMDPAPSQIQLPSGMLLPQVELQQSRFQAQQHHQQQQYSSLLQPSKSLSFEPATQSHQLPLQLTMAANTVNTAMSQEHLLHEWAEGRGGEEGTLQGIPQKSYPYLNIPKQQTKNPHHQNHPQPQEQQQQRPFQLLKLSDAGKRQIQQESVVQRWKTQMQPPLRLHLPFEQPKQTSNEQANEEPQQQHHKIPQQLHQETLQLQHDDQQQLPHQETQPLTLEQAHKPTHVEMQEQMQLLPPESSQEQLQQQAHELPHGQPQQQQGTQQQMFNSNQTHNSVLPQNVVGKYNLQSKESFIPSLKLTDASVRQIQQNYNQQEGQEQVEPLEIVSSDIQTQSFQHEQPYEQARQQTHDQPEQQSHEQAQQQPYDQQGKKDHEILKGWEKLKNQFTKHSDRMQSRAKAQLEINVGGERQQLHEQAQHNNGINSLWQPETHLVEQMPQQLPRQLPQQSPLGIQQQQQQQGVVLNHDRALSHLLPQSDGMLPPAQVQLAYSQQLPQFHLAQQQQQFQLQSNPHLLQPMHQPEQWYPHYHQSLSNQHASISQEPILQSIPHAQSRANLLEGRDVNSAIDVENISGNSSKGKRKIIGMSSSQSSSSTADVSTGEKRKKLMHDGIASGYSISPQNLPASETSQLSMSPFAQQSKMMQEVNGNRILRVHVSTDLDIEEFRVTVTRGKDENTNLLLGKNKKTHEKIAEFELSPGWKIKERDMLTVRVISVGGIIIKNRIKIKDFYFSETNLDIQFPYTDRGKITFLPNEHESR